MYCVLISLSLLRYYFIVLGFERDDTKEREREKFFKKIAASIKANNKWSNMITKKEKLWINIFFLDQCVCVCVS